MLLTPREQLIITALSLGVGMLYHVGFLRWKAATVGKLICGLRVVPVDRGRSTEKLAWNTIGIRSAIRVMPGITSVLSRVCSAGLVVPAVASQAAGHS